MRSGITLAMIADADTFVSAAGDPIHVLYSPILKDGDLILAESGKQSIPDFINSHKDLCDMNFILSRLAAGDASVLNARDAFYADVSELSWNRAEMLQHVSDMQMYFDHLPDDVRAQFGDSFATWIAQAGTSEWSDKMTLPLKDRQPSTSVKDAAVAAVAPKGADATSSAPLKGDA